MVKSKKSTSITSPRVCPSELAKIIDFVDEGILFFVSFAEADAESAVDESLEV